MGKDKRQSFLTFLLLLNAPADIVVGPVNLYVDELTNQYVDELGNRYGDGGI